MVVLVKMNNISVFLGSKCKTFETLFGKNERRLRFGVIQVGFKFEANDSETQLDTPEPEVFAPTPAFFLSRQKGGTG